MKVVIQRVRSASVEVEGSTTGAIDTGILALVGFGPDDHEGMLAPMLHKLLNLRVLPSETKPLDHSIVEKDAGLLLVPQFTLYGRCKKGRRPDFSGALNPKAAKALFEQFVESAKSAHPKVETGVFGAHMQVSLCNDGPVTLILDSKELGIL